ncbi:thiolase C-terminal domain-containing protein [Phenylobacterium sp.]|jgi:acetyl-CoA acetyltransferase|uniref:thiolase C-terminal domain-containing protein n=1 Tax=Phenylobacterium sp. TaxID=1871053 RepID=UPI0037CBA6AF
MKQKSVAVVGAAETTQMGRIPDVSVIGLHADAALNAMADCGLKPSDIDGVACAGISPTELAHYLGITPTYADGTSVGGCSFMLHVRHAAAAINAGLCTTVLITHGESGKSRVGAGGFARAPSSLMGQFEMPYGVTSPPTMFTVPVLRYLKTYGLTEEDLAWVSVIQREWAAKNPRASFKDPITVDDVLNSPMIAWPFRLLMCCLVTDGGGALILTSAERARDFKTKPVYVLGTGESVETPLVSQMEDFTSSKAFRVSGKKAFDEAGLKHADVDHLMIYDAFAHLPLYGLEDLGFCKPGEAAAFIRERNTAIGGKLPLNTNGGGLSYMHSGMYGMYALQESVRQLRGTAAAQVPGATNSVCHGVGGMFGASGTIIFSNEAG